MTVRNQGPGRVRLRFDSPADFLDDRTEPGVAVATRTLPGPVRVRCECEGTEAAVLTVRARPCDGSALRNRPPPRAADG